MGRICAGPDKSIGLFLLTTLPSSLKPTAPMFTEQSLPQQVQREDTERTGNMLIRSRLESHTLSSSGKEMRFGTNLGAIRGSIYAVEMNDNEGPRHMFSSFLTFQIERVFLLPPWHWRRDHIPLCLQLAPLFLTKGNVFFPPTQKEKLYL